MMKSSTKGYIVPSAVYTISKRQICGYEKIDKIPVVGDVIFGKIIRKGQTEFLENKHGRLHNIVDGTTAVFAFGNRYAPDYYEAFVPQDVVPEVDLLSSGGVVGLVAQKNTQIADPTRIKVLGYALDKDGKILNTKDYPLILPESLIKKPNRSKLVLVVGTSMNSGKSMAAAACCWALSSMGHNVRAAKITGTARLRDILRMEDAGASIVCDFTFFGYPSTYMLEEEEVVGIFDRVDIKYANNPKNFWVVEIADGILQRETAMLLRSESVQSRIHRLIFAAQDAFGVITGVNLLKERFGLTPHAVSGVVSSSPLALREMESQIKVPVFDNMSWNMKTLAEILI